MTHPSPLLRASSALAVTAVLAGGLIACGSEPTPCPTGPVAAGLAIAVGGHAHSPRPVMPAGLGAELDRIMGEARSGRDAGVTMIGIDGRPAVGCVVRLDTDTANPEAERAATTAFTETVGAGVAGMRAAEPESNPLESLSLAAASAGPGGTVVLVDSGLQTVAPLDFRQPGLLGAGIDTVVAALDDAAMLPDLSGRRVFLSGIGFTAAPQTELNSAQRAHLIELWRRIAEAGGAESVTVLSEPSNAAPLDGLPPVAGVDVPPAEALDLACDTEQILPDDGPVGFVPDSTEFARPPAARDRLAQFARWLAENPRARGHITGSIAHYGADSPGGLSADRAERVRSMLVDLGADPGQVSAEGAGWGPYPAAGAPPDPASDPLNRRVVIELSCR